MLDDAGLEDCKITVSNSLDEYTISSLNSQNARIDNYGVGERLITGATSDYSEDTLALLGAVYKIAAVEENGEFVPRIKISGAVEKITNPGLKKVYRVYDKKTGKAKADLIAKAEEEIDLSGDFKFVDPLVPWKNLKFTNCEAKPLQVKIFENGKRIYEMPTLQEIRDYVKYQLDNEIWEEEQRFVNPHVHYMDMTTDYYNMKMNLLNEKR
jgi:nicotinate phosphoribosyltransferase